MAINARKIDAYLKRKGSPLAGYGKDFMAQGPRVASLLVAIAGAESSFGKVNSGTHNAWGWGPGIDFSSYREAIQTIGRGLKSGYLAEGRTSIPQIGAKWAPQGAANDPTNLNSHWVKNVRQFYRELGGAPGGPQTAPNAMPGPNIGSPTPTALPDFTGAVMENLSAIGSGRYDPLEALSNLTSVAPASVPSGTGPSPDPTQTGAAPKVSALKPGGGWGGSKNIAYQLTRSLGLTATSEKRDRKNTSSGGVSDHWTGSTTAFARDLGGSVSAMDAAAVKLARQLGISYRKGQRLEATINRNGYRIQVLYRTHTGGDHFDHIHVGVRKV